MFRPATLLFFSIACFYTVAQNQSLLDSLIFEARAAQDDSIKVSYHYELCYQWAAYNFDSSMWHARKMDVIAKKSGNQILEYQAQVAKGLAHDYQYTFDSAIFYYTKAWALAEEIGYKKGVAVSNFNIGVVHYYSGEMEKAIDKYLEAEPVYVEIGDDRNLGILYNNMGLIYRKTKKHELARDSYLKSLEIKRRRNDIAGVMSTLTNLSSVYQFMEEFEKAKEASEEVIKLAKEHDNQGAYLFELVSLGKIYAATGHLDESLSLYEEAEKLLGENEPYAFRTHIFQQLGGFYVKRGAYARAKKYLDIVAESVGESELDIQLDHYLTLADYFRATNQNLKSLKAFEMAFKIRETMVDNEVAEKTTELEQLYEKEKREKEITRLSLENNLTQLRIEKATRERNALIVGALLVVCLAIMFYSLFRQKKKSLSEREILLKEIHHRVKNNLQIISSLLNLQAGSLEDEVAIDAVKEGQNRVRSMALIHEKLYLTDNLSGIAVDDYIQNLSGTLQRSFGVDEEQIKTHFDIQKLKLDIDTLIPLGLILNELISNAFKHAFPDGEGSVELSLHENHKTLDLSIKDSGPGFDETALEKNNSYGWKMVKSLSKKLKADIDIKSQAGTEILMRIKNYQLV